MEVSATAASHPVEEAALAVGGMTCASCVAQVEKALRSVPGVEASQVNLARGSAAVRFDPQRTDPGTIASAISAAGYTAVPEEPGIAAGNVEAERIQRQAMEARAWLRRAVAGILLWAPVEITHWVLRLVDSAHHGGAATDHVWMAWLTLATGTAAIVYVGRAFYRSAFHALRRGTSNMDTLIAMGATVAYVYSLIAFSGYRLGRWQTLPDLYFMEATGLLALISLGHWLEARARQSAGSAIHELLELAPAVALRLRAASTAAENRRGAAPEGKEFDEVPVAQLHVGDLVLVRPGDRVPIDGVVVDGRSTIDESMLTGEAMPVLRSLGDQVIGGTVNHDGWLVIRVTQTGGSTALAQIVKLVERAQSSKPPVQKLADRIAAVFVPVVILIALVTGVGWYAWGASHDWEAARTWAMLAKSVCSVLIIACPCALGLAVPAAVMVGTGRGAQRGILIRDVDALQKAERIDTVVLDKTGTLTAGKPVVVDVVSLNGFPREQVLAWAAAAERYSEHPLAKSIVAQAREEQLSVPEPQSFSSEAGFGVSAQIDGRTVLVGNEALLERAGSNGAEAPGSARGIAAADLAAQTVVHVALKNAEGPVIPVGLIHLSDSIKEDSAAAVAELHRMGLRTVLLTGDRRASAEAIARQVGIDDVRAEVKPSEKADAIRSLQAPARSAARHHVAMVGDGINDAPALATADLGIAIGSGSDVAKETGDIILVSGSLRGIAISIRLSRATMRTIRQNLLFAFLYNVLAIPLAALGLLNPLIAAAAMALSDVTVIGNALLLRRRKLD